KSQREDIATIEDILLTLCMTLEKRMVQNEVFATNISVTFKYEDQFRWEDRVVHQRPVQDGTELLQIIQSRMKKFSDAHQCEPLLNSNLVSMGISVSSFIPSELVQYSLFEDNVRKNNLRKTVYDIKSKYGNNKIIKAAELHEDVLKDVIGFGSVKDLNIDYA